MEPEVAFFDLEDNMNEAEAFISYIVGRILENNLSDLQELERDIEPLKAIAPFPRVHYDDAIKQGIGSISNGVRTSVEMMKPS